MRKFLLAYNHLHAKMNLPWKFEFNRFSHFVGVKDQTNKQTDKQTERHAIVLEEGCNFYINLIFELYYVISKS